MENKEYIAIVQCDIVKEVCSGYNCEASFFNRRGGFADYPADKNYRTLYFSCGGCCGRATHRKLSNLIKKLKKRENMQKKKLVVHLSSCITLESYHGPRCPHLDYLKKLINKHRLDLRLNTYISPTEEKRRKIRARKKS
jgi:predicted metal-binding protein